LPNGIFFDSSSRDTITLQQPGDKRESIGYIES
jgi:hypothetical protein